MNWMWFIGGTWIVVGIALAVLIGRSIHLATLKAEHPEAADEVASTAASAPAATRLGDRPRHAIRRVHSSPSTSARSPIIGGCVSPAARIPSEREHGVL